MDCIKEYFKNSNTGELIMRQRYENTQINFPIDYFDIRGRLIEGEPDLTGFVPISEKKYWRTKAKITP